MALRQTLQADVKMEALASPHKVTLGELNLTETATKPVSIVLVC